MLFVLSLAGPAPPAWPSCRRGSWCPAGRPPRPADALRPRLCNNKKKKKKKKKINNKKKKNNNNDNNNNTINWCSFCSGGVGKDPKA